MSEVCRHDFANSNVTGPDIGGKGSGDGVELSLTLSQTGLGAPLAAVPGTEAWRLVREAGDAWQPDTHAQFLTPKWWTRQAWTTSYFNASRPYLVVGPLSEISAKRGSLPVRRDRTGARNRVTLTLSLPYDTSEQVAGDGFAW